MKSMSRRLPPLNALRVFEVVARCGSILKAAEELGVVRGAVRQQLTVLDAHFGMTLFERNGRRLELTEKGRSLAESVAAAFGILERAAMELEAAGRPKIRIGVPSAFAVWWLMPRLGTLQAALPEIDLDIIPVTVVEPLSRHPEFDAVIMGGEYRPSPDITAIRFMEDEFGPVATPELASRLNLNDGPDALGKATGLGIRSVPRLWDDWFAESGAPSRGFARLQQFEDLLLAIAAARSGIGVAIAPKTAVGDDLARKTFIAPYGFIRRPAGFSISFRTADATKKPFSALGEWLTLQGSLEL
ncbi:LysR family transcriptional regulator [Neorhizobium sp. P12A]|uniref:LysR substrate-binding domain-containing protein n=1 Tax=Neorhizobium sp. P12A TaxID=2268027 RepID=UPI0011EC2E8B|nr:LysR substrate-binding domain-containing protein [Neorhizobium sp. P12A]KAA0699606.1 LysR family transcriptional regulator [Neorhizobium sp. P12A]